jgi:hypothetical protein
MSEESDEIMPKPCKHCPFKRGVQMFGSVRRAEEFAYMADNRYTWFHCHKTGTVDEDEGDYIATENSLECAGLVSMKVHSGTIRCPDGFTPSTDAYSDSQEMVDAYLDWLGEDEEEDEDEWVD